MNRWILRFSALVASLAMATCATAQVNLSWNDCGAAGVQDQTFTCTTNTGAPFIMFGSYISPDAPHMVAIEFYIDMIESAPTQSPWWQFDSVNIPGACRPTGISFDAAFLSGPFSCRDFWGEVGGASGGGGVNYNMLGLGVNTNRILGTYAIPAEQVLTSGDEVYGFKVLLLRTKTTGTGSCAGCLNTACIVLNRVRINQPAGVGDFDLTNAPVGGRNFVTWNGGTGANCATVPTQNRAWGQIKSLYR